MRLTKKQKDLVLASAQHVMSQPKLVRVGDCWATVGRDRDDEGTPQATWTGRIVHSIESGRVWSTDWVSGLKTRTAAMRLLRGEASK